MEVRLRDLIIVTSHAAFRDEIEEGQIKNPEHDHYWILEPYQYGEPPFYIEHIRRGVVHTANNPHVLLVFSGGCMREGGKWSGAKTYLSVAKFYKFWVSDQLEVQRNLRTNVQNRIVTEEYARDSFENLLFSICRFQQVTGYYPRNIIVISWSFEKKRFDLHRLAIRFPIYRFYFEEFNDPVDIGAAWRRESKILREIRGDQYGCDPESAVSKRKKERGSFDIEHPYKNCPGLEDFFKFVKNPYNKTKTYPKRFPWED